jgi:hypothetical protein
MLQLYCRDATTRSAIRFDSCMSPGVFPGGHEDDLSLSSSAEVKNEWSYTYMPPVHHGVYRDQSSTDTQPVLRRMPCCDNADWPLRPSHVAQFTSGTHPPQCSKSRKKKTSRVSHVNSPTPTATTLTLKLTRASYLWARFAKKAHRSCQICKFLSLHLSRPLAAIFYVSSLQEALKSNLCTTLTRYNTTQSNSTDPHAQDTTKHKPKLFLTRVHQNGLSFPLRHHSQGQNCSREPTTVETSRL